MQTIGDLEMLLKVLEDELDERWADKFSRLCNDLEVINAVPFNRIVTSLRHEEWRESPRDCREARAPPHSDDRPLLADE